MYVYQVYSPEFVAAASGRKLTGKLFRQATELMYIIDHELIGTPTSPPLALHPCPFHMGISLPSGRRLLGVYWGTHGCAKHK